jgi:oxygen-independent coproporphyrinogen III oxidase
MTGLYIHIPFCKSKCAYCDFPSYAGREVQVGRYFSALIKEAEMRREKLGDLFFETVFIGGGTPSLLPAGSLERLMERIYNIFDIWPSEFTVEANPGTLDREKLQSFQDMGATRLSLGVQAAQDDLLRSIGRIHTWADFVRAYDMARTAGFENINADMMTGLPGQKKSQAVDTAKRLAAMGLEHVSCYGLILEEGTPLHAAQKRGAVAVPDDDAERAMFHAVREVLEGAGYGRYEISNFAKPGMECRHNLNYWLNGNYLGLGCGAASHIPGRRWENRRGLDEYMMAVESEEFQVADEHFISADESAFETIMLALRLAQGLDFKWFRARHGYDFLMKYAKQVEKLVANGLMEKTEDGVYLTVKGMDLQNTALMEFMD